MGTIEEVQRSFDQTLAAGIKRELVKVSNEVSNARAPSEMDDYGEQDTIDLDHSFYLAEIKRLRESKDRIFRDHELLKLMKDKAVQNKTMLSAFTIVQNNFSELTSNHLSMQASLKDGIKLGAGKE